MRRLPLTAPIALGLLAPLTLGLGTPQDDAKKQDTEVWTIEDLESTADQIKREIEALRGKKFKEDVAVRLADHETFIEYIKQRADDAEELAAQELTAKLLGMVPGEIDLLAMTMSFLEEQVGGFYDPAEKTFYIMDSFTGGVARVIMAHELTHALDDQYHDLDGTMKSFEGNADAALAHHAVVEGSGMALMALWVQQNIGSLSMKEIMQAQATMSSDAVEAAPPFVWKPLMAVYLRGESFLRRTNVFSLIASAVRMDDIEQAFLEPPRSTEQILHPVKYWKDERRDEPRVFTSDASELAEGWKVVSENTLGELYLGIMTQPHEERSGMDSDSLMGMMSMPFTTDAAEGWGGDRYVLLEKNGAYVLKLATCWDSDADATEFHETMVKLRTGIETAMAGMPSESDETPPGIRSTMGGADEVGVLSWFGVDEKEAAAVAATVKLEEVEAEPEPPRIFPGG